MVSKDSNLSNADILTQYSNLWQVEQSFRINKQDLKIRPIYHWKPARIKAHLAIAFAAYTLVKHLESMVRLQYQKLSPEQIRQLLLRVQVSLLFDKRLNKKFILPSSIPADAKHIYRLMDVPMRLMPYAV